MNFCAAILIWRRKSTGNIFGVLCLIISSEVKMHGKHKVRFVQCTEKVLGRIKCVESGLLSFLVLLTFWPNGSLLWAVLCIERCLAAPLASTCWKPIVGDSRHTQNIQVNEVIGENEKCLLFYRKNPTDFLANSVFIVIYISFLIYQFLVSFHCFCGSTVTI